MKNETYYLIDGMDELMTYEEYELYVSELGLHPKEATDLIIEEFERILSPEEFKEYYNLNDMVA